MPRQSNNDDNEHIPLTRNPHLCLVNDTPKGRGVFASEAISKGSIIETCPVLIFTPEENREHIEHTLLYHYTYTWPITVSVEVDVDEDEAEGDEAESCESKDGKGLENGHATPPVYSSTNSYNDSSPKNTTPTPRTTTRIIRTKTIQTQALVLGLGSMFNHRSSTSNSNFTPLEPTQSQSSAAASASAGQNVSWRRNLSNQTITYFALRDIAAGEELCISYGDKLTFVDADSCITDRHGHGHGHHADGYDNSNGDGCGAQGEKGMHDLLPEEVLGKIEVDL